MSHWRDSARVGLLYFATVERHVQERLVGAAVLMAAAIILIPEMLSGPDREPSEPTAQRTVEEPAVKTYTIDLNRPPGTPLTSSVTEEAAPPPEQPQTAPSLEAPETSPPAEALPAPTQVNPERVAEAPPARASTSAPERSASADTPAKETPKSPPAETKQPEPRTVPTPASQAVPTTRGWAVQLGSFSNRATAERLAAQMRADRYDAFVMPVQTGSSTLYRVRIGPMRDRAAADETLKRIKSRVAGAAVVTHP